MVYWGLYSDSGRENGNYYTVYWGYIGVLEKKLKTTIMGLGLEYHRQFFCPSRLKLTRAATKEHQCK